MPNQVNIEDVGYAEDVLQRLVNERKSLENAVKVMQTFRATKVALVEAAKEYEEVKQNIAVARVELERVEDTKSKAITTAERQIKEYTEKETNVANEQIDKLKEMIAELEMEYQQMEGMYADEKRVKEVEIEQLRKQIKDKTEVLSKLRQEHTTLAEVIRNVAHMVREG